MTTKKGTLLSNHILKIQESQKAMYRMHTSKHFKKPDSSKHETHSGRSHMKGHLICGQSGTTFGQNCKLLIHLLRRFDLMTGCQIFGHNVTFFWYECQTS